MYGTVRTVVWEDGVRKNPSYPIPLALQAILPLAKILRKSNGCSYGRHNAIRNWWGRCRTPGVEARQEATGNLAYPSSSATWRGCEAFLPGPEGRSGGAGDDLRVPTFVWWRYPTGFM